MSPSEGRLEVDKLPKLGFRFESVKRKEVMFLTKIFQGSVVNVLH